MRALWMLALLAAGCGHFYSSDGVSEANGIVYDNGTALPHHRWVAVAVPEGTKALTLESPTADIDVTAGAPALEVQVWSEVEGDGAVALTDGKPVVSSSSGRVVLINGVRVFLTGFLVFFVSPALGEGFMHVTEGWLMFIVAFGILGMLAWVAGRLEAMYAERRTAHA